VTTVPAAPAGTRHNLTDAQWALLESLLPAPPHRGRPRRWPLRNLVDGIFFRVRTGIPCRDVPERYGPWWRIYDLFLRFRRTGVWAAVHTRLLTAAHRQEMLTWEVSVDSTTSRGHVHATGTRPDSHRRHPGEPTDHGFGWSRGGWSTKIHLAVDSGGGVSCRSRSPPVSPGTPRSWSRSWNRSGCPPVGRAGRGTVRCGCWRTRRIRRGRSAGTCGAGGLPRRSRSRSIRYVTGCGVGRRWPSPGVRSTGLFPSQCGGAVDRVPQAQPGCAAQFNKVAVQFAGSVALRGSECVAEGGATAVCHNM
jgi:transposase